MLEKKLQEVVDRHNRINKYTKNLIIEQEAPLPPPPPPGGDEELPPPPPEGDAGGESVPPPPPADAGTTPPPTEPLPDTVGDDTQEIDMTELVNMTTSIKKDLEAHTQDNSTVIAKMDDVFSKLNDLEQQISNMDSIIGKIDELGSKIDASKEKTPEEKLEMRSLDSYPFNQNPQEFFAKKQEDMRNSGKNEYVLTKDEIQNYSPDTIKKSFNPNPEDEQF